jgi:hypothetical protein
MLFTRRLLKCLDVYLMKQMSFIAQAWHVRNNAPPSQPSSDKSNAQSIRHNYAKHTAKDALVSNARDSHKHANLIATKHTGKVNTCSQYRAP